MSKRIGANKKKNRREKRSARGEALPGALKKGVLVAGFVAAAAIVCGGGIFAASKLVSWINRSPLFTVSEVRVDGCLRVNKDDAVRLCGITPGMRMTAVRPKNAQKALLRNGWVRGARVMRRFPNTVVINLDERSPVALVNIGQIRYMDDEGVLLPLFRGTYSGLPVVSGFMADTSGRLPKEAARRVVRFLDDCKKENEGFARRITQIDFSRESVVRLRLENYSALVEMTDTQTRTSVNRLMQLMDSAPTEAEKGPKRINLRYDNLAYVQK
jgi:cell division septal protein FtsQ